MPATEWSYVLGSKHVTEPAPEVLGTVSRSTRAFSTSAASSGDESTWIAEQPTVSAQTETLDVKVPSPPVTFTDAVPFAITTSWPHSVVAKATVFRPSFATLATWHALRTVP